MSANLSISSQTPVVWNESTILEKGMEFLRQKRGELKVYQKLWEASLGTGYYSDSSKITGQMHRAIAEKSLNEIEALDKAVTNLLIIKSAKDYSSEQTKNLLVVTYTSHLAVHYFKSVLNYANYPTYLNQVIQKAKPLSNKIAVTTVGLTGVAYLKLIADAYVNQALSNYRTPSWISIPFTVSIVACVAFNVINYFNLHYRKIPAKKEAQYAGYLFKKALSQGIPVPLDDLKVKSIKI